MAGLPFSEADTRAYGKFIHFSEETIVKSTVIYSLAEREKKWKKSIKKHLCNDIGSYYHVMIFENIYRYVLMNLLFKNMIHLFFPSVTHLLFFWREIFV